MQHSARGLTSVDGQHIKAWDGLVSVFNLTAGYTRA